MSFQVIFSYNEINSPLLLTKNTNINKYSVVGFDGYQLSACIIQKGESSFIKYKIINTQQNNLLVYEKEIAKSDSVVSSLKINVYQGKFLITYLKSKDSSSLNSILYCSKINIQTPNLSEDIVISNNVRNGYCSYDFVFGDQSISVIYFNNDYFYELITLNTNLEEISQDNYPMDMASENLTFQTANTLLTFYLSHSFNDNLRLYRFENNQIITRHFNFGDSLNDVEEISIFVKADKIFLATLNSNSINLFKFDFDLNCLQNRNIPMLEYHVMTDININTLEDNILTVLVNNDLGTNIYQLNFDDNLQLTSNEARIVFSSNLQGNKFSAIKDLNTILYTIDLNHDNLCKTGIQAITQNNQLQLPINQTFVANPEIQHDCKVTLCNNNVQVNWLNYFESNLYSAEYNSQGGLEDTLLLENSGKYMIRDTKTYIMNNYILCLWIEDSEFNSCLKYQVFDHTGNACISEENQTIVNNLDNDYACFNRDENNNVHIFTYSSNYSKQLIEFSAQNPTVYNIYKIAENLESAFFRGFINQRDKTFITFSSLNNIYFYQIENSQLISSIPDKSSIMLNSYISCENLLIGNYRGRNYALFINEQLKPESENGLFELIAMSDSLIYERIYKAEDKYFILARYINTEVYKLLSLDNNHTLHDYGIIALKLTNLIFDNNSIYTISHDNNQIDKYYLKKITISNNQQLIHWSVLLPKLIITQLVLYKHKPLVFMNDYLNRSLVYQIYDSYGNPGLPNETIVTEYGYNSNLSGITYFSDTNFTYTFYENSTYYLNLKTISTPSSLNDTNTSRKDLNVKAYPNPFNPSTTISFQLEKDSNVDVSIYNIKGQKVTSLLKGKLTKGHHSFNWNGMNKNQDAIASGMYLCRIKTDNQQVVTKLYLIK